MIGKSATYVVRIVFLACKIPRICLVPLLPRHLTDPSAMAQEPQEMVSELGRQVSARTGSGSQTRFGPRRRTIANPAVARIPPSAGTPTQPQSCRGGRWFVSPAIEDEVK